MGGQRALRVPEGGLACAGGVTHALESSRGGAAQAPLETPRIQRLRRTRLASGTQVRLHQAVGHLLWGRGAWHLRHAAIMLPACCQRGRLR